MAKVGALVVGIGGYAYGAGSPLPPLKYAAADADGIEAYLAVCWPNAGDRHVVRIAETEATRDALAAGFADLAANGPFEVQIIFLSGHGVAEPGRWGFLLQPDPSAPGLSLLGPGQFDQLLALPKAERTVLVLDCCYAEAILCRMRFFSELGTDRARLFVGSSRANQLTWEEEGAGHGVFTAHLLDLLNTGSSASLAGVRDVLDVDGELFPILCGQVPLYVLEHKRAEQEPIKGGLASAAVRLPVARATRRLKERTPLATALRRVRQIAVGVAGAGAAFLLFAYTMLYYIEPDASGSLVVRHGTRWLEPMFRYLAPTRVDTGIPASDLSDNPAAAFPLQAGYTTGVWTHTSRPVRYRAWFDTVSTGLSPASAARLNVLVGVAGRTPAQLLGDQSRPADVALAAWAALVQNRPGDLDRIYARLPGVGRLASPALSPFNPNQFDFEILDQTAADMQGFAEALCYGAALDPARTLPAYVGFAKATQEWLAHNSDAQRGRDARAQVRSAVADCLGVIARARADRGLPPLDPSTTALFEALSGQGYAEVIDTALSRVRGAPLSGPALTRTLAAFAGDPVDPVQNSALEAIMVSLTDSAQSRAIVDQVYGRFEIAGNLENGYLSRFLIEAADARAFSPALVSRLVVGAKESLAKPEPDFMDSERARVLAHAMSQVPSTERASVYRLIERAAKEVTPMSGSTAEMYAALARQRLDRPAMLAHVQEQAQRAKPYRPHDPGVAGSPMPGMTIVVGTGPWVAALAQFGQTRKLPAVDVAVLREHLANPAVRELVAKALIVQENAGDHGDGPDRWIREVAATPGDHQARRLRQEVAARTIAAMPRAQFLAAIASMRAAREKETEPEVRIALGSVLADAQYWRVSQPTSGQGLFD